MHGVRTTVAGDDAALYNSLLLTVKTLRRSEEEKPSSSSPTDQTTPAPFPPEDVAELAQSTGTIIYIISTRQAQDDPVSAAAFERVSKASGGKAYFAKNWRQENRPSTAKTSSISTPSATTRRPIPTTDGAPSR